MFLKRPFVKLKECGSSRPNISRSSSSTSSFSSTTGETEPLEELETVRGVARRTQSGEEMQRLWMKVERAALGTRSQRSGRSLVAFEMVCNYQELSNREDWTSAH